MASKTPNSCRSAIANLAENAAFFDLSPDLLAIVGNDGFIQRTNPAWSDVLGYAELALRAQPFLAGVHPDDRSTTLATIEQLTAGGPAYEFENRYRAKDGSYRHLAWKALLPLNQDSFYCVGRDITQQREMEVDLQATRACLEQLLTERTRAAAQAHHSLRESEVRFRTALDHIPDVFVIYDAQRRIQFINAAGPKLTNRPIEDFLGRTDEEVHPPEVTSAYLPLLLRAVETKQYQTGECTIALPGGEPYTIVVQYVPLLNTQGGIQQILGITHDITERKRTEAALRQSEAQNRAILTAIPDLITRVGIDGIYRGYVAERKNFDLLTPNGNLVGRAMAEVLPPAMAERKNYFLQRAIQTGEMQIFEQQVQAGQDVRHEEVRAVRCGADEVLFIIRDISERKQAETDRLAAAQLHRELRLLENVFNLILAGYWDWDIPAHKEYYSAGFKHMLGYEEHELADVPETWQRLIFPDDLIKMSGCLERHLSSRGQEPYYGEVRYRHKDGATVWVICSGQVIEWDEEGNPLRMIGCHINISDRKAAEMQLSTSEEKFRNFVEHVNAIIYTLSPDGRFTYVSPSWTTILGHALNEVVDYSFLPFVHPEDQGKCLEFLGHILAGSGAQPGPEYRVKHKNGEWRWHTSQATPQRDKNGQIVSYLGVAYDITDRKQAEAQLQQANQTLERATRLKDEFLANMSHELRTPLNAILGMSEGLQEAVFGPINERQHKALKTIESSGSHLLVLINDILDLSKIEAGRMELNLTPTDPAQLCRSSMALVHQQAIKKGLQLHLSLPPQLPTVSIDERRMRQVLINLLGNAVKFTPEGGCITLSVDISAPSAQGATTGYLQMSVIDTGIGIAAKDQAKLFQPFTQIEGALNRKYEGTGLGLALVKHLVELHGGQVKIASEVNAGSCFTVELPYRVAASLPSAAEADRVQPLASDGADLGPPQTAPLILLAEDNEANIATIGSYLEAKGYRLVLARNGHEAVALAGQAHPDLVLMDIQMPTMNGLDAIQAIRQNSGLAELPIIALTALAMEGDCDRCLAAGATAYLSKPVRLQQLVAQIQELIQ